MQLFCRLSRQHWLQSAVEARVGTVQKQLDLGVIKSAENVRHCLARNP